MAKSVKQRIHFQIEIDVDGKVNFPSDWIKISATMPKEAGKIVSVKVSRTDVSDLEKWPEV